MNTVLIAKDIGPWQACLVCESGAVLGPLALDWSMVRACNLTEQCCTSKTCCRNDCQVSQTSVAERTVTSAHSNRIWLLYDNKDILITKSRYLKWQLSLGGNVITRINKVNQHWAALALGWVIVDRCANYSCEAI